MPATALRLPDRRPEYHVAIMLLSWFWVLVAVVLGVSLLVFAAIAHLSVRSPDALRRHYRRHFGDHRRERLFLAALSFFVTFLGARVITHAIRAGIGPFRDIGGGTTHVHHLVWGILLLLAVGTAWLAQVGVGPGLASRATAVLFGIASALTLDEFALWLRLEDVYWTPEGRTSVDAVLLFGSLLLVGSWSGSFVRSVLKESVRMLRRPTEH